MNENSAIDLRDVQKRYSRKVWALRGIDMRVNRGDVFGLLGPNGAGKSTLVKIMMTVIRPTRATGTVLGNAVGHKATLSRIGYLPEHHRFPRYLTGRQSLDFFGALSKVPRRERRLRTSELLEQVGMTEAADRKVGTYSKGMMQRVGVAAALMNDPDLILLDEPTDGVDPVGRRDIRDILLRLKARGKTVFINSHLLSELEMICDRVAILVNGAVAKQGTRDEIAIGRGFFKISFAAPLAGGGWNDRVLEGIPAAAFNGDSVNVETTDAAVVQPIIDRLRAASATIHQVQLVRPTLEDLFMEAIGAPANGEVVK